MGALRAEDSSLAGPRTQLAWRRTAVGFVVVALVELRNVNSCGLAWLTGGVTVLALITAIALLASTTTNRRVRPLLLTLVAVLSISIGLVQEVWVGAGC